MRWLVLPLLVLLPSAVSAADPPDEVVRRWIDAVLAHRPGVVDQALRDAVAAGSESFEIVAQHVGAVLKNAYPDPRARNDVRRRGALLHTDIALLLPEQAATFTPRGGREAVLARDEVVLAADGQFITTAAGGGHWSLASWLLRGVTPRPSSDEFVRAWHRAVAAVFQFDFRFGSSAHHLKRANEIVPNDPVLLFYAGAMHEALASPRFQSVPATAPRLDRQIGLPSEDGQLKEAERFLREALEHGAPPEAQLRLGRVVGRRGRHAEAVAWLRDSVVPGGDARLAFLQALLLGTELGAVGQVEAARASFERASAMFPTAQSPLVAMSDVFRRSGNRAAALDVLRRLEALPADPSLRSDPWWDYERSYAADAWDQLSAVRAWVDRREGR